MTDGHCHHHHHHHHHHRYLVMEAFDDDPFKTFHRRRGVALLPCKMKKIIHFPDLRESRQP